MTVSSLTTNPQKCFLTPPDTLSLIGRNESSQPSQEQEDIVLEASREYWYRIASLASTYLEHGLTPELTNPKYSIRKVPKFQSGLKQPSAQLYCHIGDTSLCYEASSTWTLGGDGCDAVETETKKPALLLAGVKTPTPYSFDGEVFNQWPGTIDENAKGPNYLGILAVGWCYILSAELVEKQGGAAAMRYTDCRADCLGLGVPNDPPQGHHLVDVGDADARTVRWWSAILAKGQGWKATITEKFHTPWSINRTCETCFCIKQTNNQVPSFSDDPTTLTSDEAFSVLLEFASLHNAGSQFSVALTTAMSFTMHQYWPKQDAKLPPPRELGARVPVTTIGPYPHWTELKKNLPYYMTLSCSPEVMFSTLCGSFWQFGVPSNLVTQWLHPVLEEVLDDAMGNGKSQELMGLIGGIRRPGVGALWIGAAICGFGPAILQRSGRSDPVERNAFPWTGVPHSYMDDAGSGPYTLKDPGSENTEYILRRDVWRLLDLNPIEADDDIGYPLKCDVPWEPLGTSPVKQCALRVAAHFNCARHAYEYDYYTWELENGATKRDYGFSNEFPSLSAELSYVPEINDITHTLQKKELDPYRGASDRNTDKNFSWFINGEGATPGEQIYSEDDMRIMWEQVLDTGSGLSEEREKEDPKEVETRKRQNLEAWLDALSIEISD